ncbi:tRNA-specific adenosine deaminase [Companilactobacillus sp. RD055328]|uniref:nucleoside deaminase n=1 Tax=Companilactobacillus sp. RD055328 TaxID=2916634 RepID=UPI001FC8CC01|nr:nucleoside deaminase [Companilactobacillus sp. RD055328]GKQ42161.1 tRNA-specific adenosine deaminase [Companilactobacillus sp. RD055328]
MKTKDIFTVEELDQYMKLTLLEAKNALAMDEVPIGALIVDNETKEILSAGFNKREHLQDSIFHAEIEAIQEACKKKGSWRLENTTLFVTLEPCPMCAGAIINSRIPNVVYGAKDPKAGSVDSLNQLLSDERYNHQADVESGIMENECATILTDFFKEIRRKNKS